jgi:hypothetical protein
MITISTGKNISTKYKDYIDDCVNALFCSFIGNYDIHVNFRKFIDTDHVHAGFCLGDDTESVVDIATPLVYECGEETRYTPVEIARTLAHEIVHAKQFARGQINLVDHVWRRGEETIDCTGLNYDESPWEVEAYAYEDILTDLFWENE